MRTEPKRVSAVPAELIPPERQAKMVAAFERARTERLATQIPVEGTHSDSDPRVRANTAAFLVLEGERRAVATRLSRPYRRRRDRYRDLILVTKLIRLEYEHLAGRPNGGSGSLTPSNGLPVSGDRPADWARPWGSGPMVEMGTALAFYQDQRDRLAKRLSAPSRGSAAAAAAGQQDPILSRFEGAKGGLTARPESLLASEPQKTWPRPNLRLSRRAAAVATVFVAVGAGAVLAGTRGGEPLDAVSAPSRAVATVPEALAAVSERPRETQPAPGSAAPEPRQDSTTEIPQPDLTAPEAPPPAYEPIPEAAPVPVAAPAPTPPPPPQPPRTQHPTRPQAPARPRFLPPAPSRLPAPAARLRRRGTLTRAAVRARLAMIAAVGGLALAAAPQALADPIPTAPADDATVHRTRWPTHLPGEGQRRHATRIPRADGLPRLPEQQPCEPEPILTADRDDSIFLPCIGRARTPTRSGPNRPGTYFWQARYDDCALADPNCSSEIRSLTIDPLRPPTHRLPADGATIPYGEDATFSLEDVGLYARDGTRIEIEFSTGTARSSDGTFADPELIARPTRVAGGLYRYRLSEQITEKPGTHYWIVGRFDSLAEPDGYVTDGEIRSFTVAPPVPALAPNTVLNGHPPRRTRKRRVRFEFSSTNPDASFQCYYSSGWSRCRSPQRFRRLEPGRYRFKVRAVANGKRDSTPASWLFKVARRR